MLVLLSFLFHRKTVLWNKKYVRFWSNSFLRYQYLIRKNVRLRGKGAIVMKRKFLVFLLVIVFGTGQAMVFAEADVQEAAEVDNRTDRR